MMGSEGLKLATQVAILNANYIANRLKDHFPILYKGSKGNVAHECIIDIRTIKLKKGYALGFTIFLFCVVIIFVSKLVTMPIDAIYFKQVDRACSTVKTVSGPPKMVRLST